MADPNHLLAWLQRHRVNEEFPELQQLQPLPLTELARRLCHLYAKGGASRPKLTWAPASPSRGSCWPGWRGTCTWRTRATRAPRRRSCRGGCSARVRDQGLGFRLSTSASWTCCAHLLEDCPAKSICRIKAEGQTRNRADSACGLLVRRLCAQLCEAGVYLGGPPAGVFHGHAPGRARDCGGHPRNRTAGGRCHRPHRAPGGLQCACAHAWD